MKKTFLEWVAYILLFLWQLPQNIVGLVFWLVFAIDGAKKVIDETKWSKAWVARKMSGGISFGSFVFVSPNLATKPACVAHELKGHTVDSRILGPLYLLVIGLPSMLHASFDFTKCYYDFFTEKLANEHAGLEVDEDCVLRFKKETTN